MTCKICGESYILMIETEAGHYLCVNCSESADKKTKEASKEKA